MSEKWTHPKPGAIALGLVIYGEGVGAVNLAEGGTRADARNYKNGNVLMADANYGAAIRPFAEAAEKAILQYKKASGKVFWDGGYVHVPLRDALALLPNPPKPTLAEQGEEIKAFIQGLKDYQVHPDELDHLSDLVDAIVAGKD